MEEEEQPRRPFALLPFYGEHKRAVSSLSFASSYSSGSSSSYNSNNRHANTRALCASASADGTARIWDVTRDSNTGKLVSSSTSTNGASSIAPEGNSGDGGTRIDPTTSLIGHSRGINDVAWSPTAAYVATASDDKTLRLWNAETGDAYVEFRGHANFVFACRFNPLSNLLVNFVFACQFNPLSNLLVSGSYDETIKLWDVRCGECVATLPAHSNPVTCVDFNRDGTMIVSGSYDGLVRIWDTATCECLKTVYAEGNPPVGNVRFSPNGRFVLSGTLDSKLRLYDLSVVGDGGRGCGGNGHTTKTRQQQQQQPRGGKCAKTYSGGHINTKYCTFASFLVSSSSSSSTSTSTSSNLDIDNNYLHRRASRSCVVSGSEDGKVYLYDLQSRLIQQTLEGHTDAVLAVDAHDTLELIGSGGMANDKCVRFWAPL